MEENINYLNENKSVLIFKEPDINPEELPVYKSLEISEKIIIIEKAKKLNITGSYNTIIIPNIPNIWELMVLGDNNIILNYNNNIFIELIGWRNYIKNKNVAHTKEQSSAIEFRINGNYNNIINEGNKIFTIIIGNNNKYCGVDGDKVKLLIPSNPFYFKDFADKKDITIGKDYLSHKEYTFFKK